MPTYDYRCRKCGNVFEVFHSMTDDTPRKCPKCKSRAEKVPGTGAGLLFKGSGFYITDYRSSAYQDKAKQDKPAAAPSESGASPASPPASTAPSSSSPASSGAAAPKGDASPSRRGRGKPGRSKKPSR